MMWLGVHCMQCLAFSRRVNSSSIAKLGRLWLAKHMHCM